MRNILALGRTVFIYSSTVGFWYMVIPTHITSMIVAMISYGILSGIAFLIIEISLWYSWECYRESLY